MTIFGIYINVVWILLAIEIIGLIALAIYYAKKREKASLFAIGIDVIGIIITIYQLYPHTVPDSYIPRNAPIEYHGNGYNEGWYYGGWRDGMPQGKGHLDYDFFTDGKYYYLFVEDQDYKALYYDGEFDRGYRVGQGTVVYEGGFWDEGTFYGVWTEGKLVFEGKRWMKNETFYGYRELQVYATSAVDADERVIVDWVSVERE